MVPGMRSRSNSRADPDAGGSWHAAGMLGSWTSWTSWSWCSLALVSALVACNLCDRDGCEAYAEPVTSAEISTGIAGIAASQSDVSENGCTPCTLSVGTFYVWATPAPIADAAAAEPVVVTQPTHTISVDERYEQALDPGHYLACRDGESPGDSLCAPFTLADGEVATVSIKATYGGGDLRVFLPGSNDLAEVFAVDGGPLE